MHSLADLDAATVFIVNAASLFVFSVVYLVAWSRMVNRGYWFNLAVANIIFSVAFLIFSQRIGGSQDALLLPNCLLAIGLGFRWQAIRAFFAYSPTHFATACLTLLVAGLLYSADMLGTGVVFGAVNVVLTIQLVAIIHTLASERHRHLPSVWGLIAAYGIMVASSVLRVMQGWLAQNSMDNLLPEDLFLNIHLMNAAIHIVASGAFSLSLAYERGAETLKKAALQDPLTGLLNRAGLEQAAAKMMDPTITQRAVLIVDIDRFKSINDAHGHLVGDRVIERCGMVIGANLRETDVAARIGGEEFVALLPNATTHDASLIAERIRQAIEAQQVNAGDVVVRFTVSVGIGYSDDVRLPFRELLSEADRQLYRSKEDGRNLVRAAFAT